LEGLPLLVISFEKVGIKNFSLDLISGLPDQDLNQWQESLEAAIASAAKLPPQDQDALAALLVAEMESEERWGDLFSHSQGLLAELAQQALLEHAAGKTQPLPGLG
jgi:hypothetical protein